MAAAGRNGGIEKCVPGKSSHRAPPCTASYNVYSVEQYPQRTVCVHFFTLYCFFLHGIFTTRRYSGYVTGKQSKSEAQCPPKGGVPSFEKRTQEPWESFFSHLRTSIQHIASSQCFCRRRRRCASYLCFIRTISPIRCPTPFPLPGPRCTIHLLLMPMHMVRNPHSDLDGRTP